jgi:hypothetical protein
MNSDYTDVINEISQVLFSAIQEREPDLRLIVHALDRDLYKMLRAVGLQVMSMLFSWLSTQLTQSAKATGFVVQRRKQVKYTVLFGELEIESPYLWDKKSRRGARPVKDELGIQHGGQSLGVERALADFGAEESFGQAAKRFEEHYGWVIDRSRIGREVEKTAFKAEQYVVNRLVKAGLDSSQPLTLQPKTEKIVVELDGCHIRTGVLAPSAEVEAGLTKKQRLPKRRRLSDWRSCEGGVGGSTGAKRTTDLRGTDE